jgi:hypothetical protein
VVDLVLRPAIPVTRSVIPAGADDLDHLDSVPTWSISPANSRSAIAVTRSAISIGADKLDHLDLAVRNVANDLGDVEQGWPVNWRSGGADVLVGASGTGRS